MAFPHTPGKHEGRAVISPQLGVAPHLARGGLIVPEAAIIAFNRPIATHLQRLGARLHTGYPGPWRSMYLHGGASEDAPVGVVTGFGIGAPAAVKVLEDLIALGVRRFLSIGIAGGLGPTIGLGEVVVCTGAIRDEGTSHHYLPSHAPAKPSAALAEALRERLRSRAVAFHDGPTWTTDAVYRETVDEAVAFRDQGIATVEMEAAALFAVATYRGVEMASAFVVSDHLLAGDEWVNAIGTAPVDGAVTQLLDLALETLGEPHAAEPEALPR